MHSLLQQFSDAMADLAASATASLVQITDGQGSVGAGTVWHADGLIITNAHVVTLRPPWGRRRGDAQPVRTRRLQAVLADGRTLPAQVLALDEQHDLAALSVNTSGLSTIAPGHSERIRPGQWVLALGHPWGVRDALTAGVVIGTGDNLPEMQPGREWIALNLTLRPGHSGGPLLDMDGSLLGVNTMISGPEVGYAVPAHVVKRFLRDGLGERVTDSVITVPAGEPIQSV